MATTLPSNRQPIGTRPIAHARFVSSCAVLLATFGAACLSAATDPGEPTAQPAAVDTPMADAALQAHLAEAKEARDANELLLESLQRAADDLSSLAAVRNEVLHAYPALQRLHRQWSAVYDQRQRLLETLLPAHPRVQLCLAKEEALQPELQRELRTALDAAHAAQPLLNAQLQNLADRVAERAVPSEPQQERDQRPPHAAPQPPSDPADQQQHLAELEARTAALARAEQALAAAQARIAATAASNTPSIPQPPRGGSQTQSHLATGIPGGLVAGGFVGLVLVLVTARLTRSSTPPAMTAPVPPPLPREVNSPAPAGRIAEAAIPSTPVSPVVTVPIAQLSPPPRRPSKLPPRPSSQPNRPQSRMTLKEALVRCAETAAAQGR